jgi:cell division septation protein DedD
MFRVTKQAEGDSGAFVKLVRLNSDDYAVVARYPGDDKLNHVYVGPDQSKAEEVFEAELAKIAS